MLVLLLKLLPSKDWVPPFFFFRLNPLEMISLLVTYGNKICVSYKNTYDFQQCILLFQNQFLGTASNTFRYSGGCHLTLHGNKRR